MEWQKTKNDSIQLSDFIEEPLSQTPPIKHIAWETPAPLSFAQERLWFLDQFEADRTVYIAPTAVRLTGSLDVITLQRSLAEIMRRHQVLRTTLTTLSGQPVQVIAPTLTVGLPLVDLQELTETEREAEVQRLITQEVQRPFDLTRDSLVRATLLKLAAGSDHSGLVSPAESKIREAEHVFLLTMHHIITDDWSIDVFWQEMATLYAAFSTGEPSPLPEPSIQYTDFAVWQRQWLQGEVLDTQLAYWREQLGGAPAVLELPTDRPRPAFQTYGGATLSFILPDALTAALQALSREEGSTPFMTLLAAFNVLLYRYTGQKDILVGSPIANRNRAEIEGLIGFFVNTLVLRTDLGDNPSFRELLGRVRGVTLEAYAHQDLPFEMLVEELEPERDLSRSPLFQVMFILHDTPTQALALPDLTMNPMKVESKTAQFDLTLSMEETEQGLRGALEYNTDLFDAATITRMAGHLQTLLEGIVANPDQRLRDLPLLTEAERCRLLVEWNDTEEDYPQDKCIHHSFEDQVERTPDGGSGVRGSAPDLSGTELAGQPTGALSEDVGRGAGDPRRRVPGAVAGGGRRTAGHSQGGGGLRATRPLVSAGATGLHAERCAGVGAVDGRATGGAVVRARGTGVLPGQRRARD